MAGYIGKSQGVTQVDGYNRTEADDRYVNASGDTMTGDLALPAGGLTVGTDQLSVDASGNVLVGTTSGDVFTNQTRISVNGTNYGGLSLFSGGSRRGQAVGSSAQFEITSSGEIPLLLGTNDTERMRIDSAGRVTMPYQPAFLACKDDNSGLIGSGAYVFNDVFINTGNSYNPSTGRFTAPTTGVYWFTTTLQMWGMSVGSYCQFTFFKNGAGYPYSLSSGPYGFQVITQKTGATDYHNSVSLSGAIQLNVGDYVNVEMLPSGYARGMQSHFSGYLIG